MRSLQYSTLLVLLPEAFHDFLQRFPVLKNISAPRCTAHHTVRAASHRGPSSLSAVLEASAEQVQKIHELARRRKRSSPGSHREGGETISFASLSVGMETSSRVPIDQSSSRLSG